MAFVFADFLYWLTVFNLIDFCFNSYLFCSYNWFKLHFFLPMSYGRRIYCSLSNLSLFLISTVNPVWFSASLSFAASYMIFLEVCFLLHPGVLEKLYFHFFKTLPTFSWDFFIESCILQKCTVQSSSVWYFPTLSLLLISSLIPLCLWRKHRMASSY